ncbi:UPF0235 protein C15orf40 homolog [Glandiceps talaboti]
MTRFPSTFYRYIRTTPSMPKKKSPQTKGKRPNESDTKSAGQVSPAGPVKTNKDGSISITIQAKPGAKQNAITDISSDSVGVQIAAPPVDGEANTELVRYLASVLSLRKSHVELDKGSKSRSKTIKITDTNLSVDEVVDKLTMEKDS